MMFSGGGGGGEKKIVGEKRVKVQFILFCETGGSGFYGVCGSDYGFLSNFGQ